MKQRQGQCDHCRVVWVWSLNVKITEQVCLTCSRTLVRVRPAAYRTGPDRYHWITWEGYRA